MTVLRRAAFAALVVAVPFAAPLDARAQSVAQIVGADVKHVGEDFFAVWTSPLRGSQKDFLITAGVLGAAALVSPFDDEGDRWAVRNRDRGMLDAIRPFRRGGSLYSINELGPYVAGLYVVGVATNKRGIRDGVMGCAAAYTANTTIRHQLIYRVIGRKRPEPQKDPDISPTPPARQGDQYQFNVPADGFGEHSFPGGHVATMATCASFFSHRFQWGPIEPALAGLVAVMGVGRIADRGHWISDQIVGTAFGFAVGREVARRQLKRRDRERVEQAQRTGLGPVRAGERSGVTGDPFLSTGEVTRLGFSVTF